MTRDPRTDPQPGDELRGAGQSRRVLKRDGDRVLIHGRGTRYWMRVDRLASVARKERGRGRRNGEAGGLNP